MSGLWCPDEVWVVGDEEIVCTYTCNKTFGKCAEDFCVEGAEIVEASGKLKVEGKCVKVLGGKGRGELRLKPVLDEVKVNGYVIKVKRLKIIPIVRKAWLKAPTEVTLRFEGSPGKVGFSGFIYGNPVSGEVEVPGEVSFEVIPVSPGGHLELSVYPHPQVILDLPPPQPPVESLELLGDPLLGLPLKVMVKGRPKSEFKVKVYGTEAKGKTDEEGKGMVTVIPKEKDKKAVVIIGEYSKTFEVPEPKEPIRLKSASISGSELVLEISSVKDFFAKVIVTGIVKLQKDIALKKGENEVRIRLEELPPFTKRVILGVRVRVGEYEESTEVEGELSGVAKVVLFDGKRLWVYSTVPSSLGMFELREGVNVIEPPLRALRPLIKAPCPGPGAMDLVLAIACGKCVKVFSDGKDLGSVCLDEEIVAIDVDGERVLASGKTSSLLLTDPRKPAKVLPVGAVQNALGEDCMILCSPGKCHCYSLTGKKLWDLPIGADKLEEFYILKDGKLYMIEGKWVRFIDEVDDFSSYGGELAILKGKTVTIGNKSFEVDGNKIELGKDFLVTYGGEFISIYSKDGKLLYRKKERARSVKVIDSKILVSTDKETTLYEPVYETFEEPLIKLEEIPSELRNERAFRFITMHYESVIAYKDCFLSSHLPLDLVETLELCKLSASQPEYSEVFENPDLIDDLPSLKKYLSVMRIAEKGGMLGRLAKDISSKALPLKDLKLYKALKKAEEVLNDSLPTLKDLNESLSSIREALDEIGEIEEGDLWRRVSEIENVGELSDLLLKENMGLDELAIKVSREIRNPEHLLRKAEEAIRLLERSKELLVEGR
ncbi:hypothetical protein IPA_06850 [Ignicoccus pacificus DSM 13166]|uniref:Uncharacterized protein n=1 Tax=Ignicoccus pacificus DSM 13166 TaxID=940294 RepID=A0A977KBL5_9CREN|nr:hypothetical protein IPA_06850 [Ignicoccus pacificus DSM 13166]